MDVRAHTHAQAALYRVEFGQLLRNKKMRKIGDREFLLYLTNEISIDPDHYCPGSIVGTCGGEYCGNCS